MKKIIVLFSLITCLLPFGVYGADVCEYRCNLSSAWQNDADFCAAQVQGGTVSSNAEDCDLGATANLVCAGSKKVCCCSPGISNIVSETSIDTSVKPLNFTPEISIPGSVFDNQASTAVGNAYKTVNNETGITTVTMKSDLLAKYIQALYNYALAIVSILAAIVLMGGGLMWLTSGGDSGKVTKAKEMIIGSLSGLVILFCAWIILNTVNPELLKLKTIDTVVINRINMTCCEKNGKAEMTTEKSCKDEGGQSYIGYAVNNLVTKCEIPGCCVTKSTQNNKITDCYNSQESNCAVTDDERSNGSIFLTITTTFIKSSCETAKNTREDLRQATNCPDNCANAGNGTSCGGAGNGYCYNGLCWKWKGKEGEPCGGNDGSMCGGNSSWGLTSCKNGRDLSGNRSCSGVLLCCKK